jgi:hypothetical protein
LITDQYAFLSAANQCKKYIMKIYKCLKTTCLIENRAAQLGSMRPGRAKPRRAGRRTGPPKKIAGPLKGPASFLSDFNALRIQP